MILLPPSPELQVLIRKELNTRESLLEEIKDWLAKQPHLPDTWCKTPFRYYEDRLMNFLQGCRFSLEKCKRKLDLYFILQTTVPKFFADRDARGPELQEITKYAGASPLPTLTPEGRRVILIFISDKKWTHFSVEDVFKRFLMLQDIRLGEESFGVTGDVYIFDTSLVTSAHAAKLTPSLVKKTHTFALICSIGCAAFLENYTVDSILQEAYPIKLKEFHLVNVHPLIEVLFKWLKQFLKEKIVRRVYLHSHGYDSLYRFVPRKVLPEEYGGTARKLQDFHDDWASKLEEYTPWFTEQENVKADIFKRPEEMVNPDNTFGVDGSFKQLTFD